MILYITASIYVLNLARFFQYLYSVGPTECMYASATKIICIHQLFQLNYLG